MKKFTFLLLLSSLISLNLSTQAFSQLTATTNQSLQATPIQAKDVQIIFSDLQPELIEHSKTITPNDLSKNAQALAQVASNLDIPITFTVVPYNGKNGTLLPSLTAFSTQKNTFPRLEIDPFNHSGFAQHIQDQHRKIIVIAGYTSDVAVYQTAVSALKRGYKVYIPVDAIAGHSERIDNTTIRNLEQQGANSTSVVGFSAQLVPDFTQPNGVKVIQAISPLLK